MGRARRQIYSGQVYEICMRTRQGLPFVCTDYMKMLIEGIMARVQRDQKVVLCHHLWMGNHPHIIVVAKDKRACTAFYGEIQKQLTEAIKRLTGLKHLTLWKNNATSVIPYHDVETICYRIAYLYANPARANLVGTVSDYQGASSWKSFKKRTDSSEYSVTQSHPWVRPPMIERLPRSSVTRAQDRRICSRWEHTARESHSLTLYPNAWMKSLGVDDDGVSEVNERILHYLTALEEEARENRKTKVMQKKRLQQQALDLRYQPKKPSRRIMVYSLDKKLRIYLIKAYRAFCNRCRKCYETVEDWGLLSAMATLGLSIRLSRILLTSFLQSLK